MHAFNRSTVSALSNITNTTRNQAMNNDLQKESLKQLLLAQKVHLLDKIAQERGGLKTRPEAAADLAPAEQSHAQNITNSTPTVASLPSFSNPLHQSPAIASSSIIAGLAPQSPPLTH
jgi:hypothetical protein